MTPDKPVVRDYVIPLARFPHLHDTDTLKDAVELIFSFTCGESARLMYSELFVFNAQDQLAGRVSLQDILKTFDKRLVETPKVEHFEGKSTEYSNLTILWEESFFIECAKKHKIPLQEIMSPVKRIAKADDSLVKALSMLLHGDELVLPVVDGKSVIGFIRLEEIFKAVCGLCKL
ncbi:MAG: CBS domain-containing protein [Desulfobulbaceae bacterium]|nr:CBS domain-containing protein [Desulfobulbaceae bacterium]